MVPLLATRPTPLDRMVLDLVRGDLPSPTQLAGNFEALLHLAARHRVMPLVLARLRHLPPELLPEDAQRRLDALQHGWDARHLRQEVELERAAAAMRGAGLQALVLKGPALGRLAYADPALRGAADLDLLVEGHQFPNALACLERAGFALRNPAKSQRYHRPFHYHDVLVGPSGLILELHWGLSRPDDLFSLSAATFLAHGETITDAPPVLWSSPTDLLLHTAAQALGDGFTALGRIVDADALLRRCGQRLDLKRLRSDSLRGGLAPTLWLLLDLCRTLLDSPLDAALHRSLHPGKLVSIGLTSLDPASALVSGLALKHTGLRQLYTCWLVVGTWRRLRAVVRIVRLPAMKVALRGRPTTIWARLRGLGRRLLTLVRLIFYQTARLARLPLPGR